MQILKIKVNIIDFPFLEVEAYMKIKCPSLLFYT